MGIGSGDRRSQVRERELANARGERKWENKGRIDHLIRVTNGAIITMHSVKPMVGNSYYMVSYWCFN